MKNISECDVVVIGAGAAGLAATAELIKHKKSVICVEAMDRIEGDALLIIKYLINLLISALIGFIVTQIIRLHMGLLKKDVFEIYKIDEKLQFMKVTKNQTEKSY